ncbi:MAG: hypothetical protein LBS95_00970 [Mycoplasmataceae bacterium]|nr:hypothetical protein [Mycoplasmataceae bacterium]
MFRIPYVGSYIDAIFFDYTFGTCKYFLYLAIIVTCTIGMIRYDLFKIIISKRVLIAFTLVLSSLVMIVSGVHHEIIQVLGNDNFWKILLNYHTHFSSYFMSASYGDFFNLYITGGIFAEFSLGILELFTPIVFILIAIPLMLFGISIFINRKIFSFDWIKKMFPRLFQNEITSEYKMKITQIKESKIVEPDTVLIKSDIAINNATLPSIDYLLDTSENNNQENLQFVEEQAFLINKILRDNNIKTMKQKFNVMPIFSQIIYTLKDEDEVDDLLKYQFELYKKLNIGKFIISTRKNTVTFEILNPTPSKISIKNILKKIGSKKLLPVGIDINDKSVFFDIENNHSLAIYGTTGSGVSMLVLILIFSYIYLNRPDDAQVILLSPDKNGKIIFDNFSSLPHFKKAPALSIDECHVIIDEYMNDSSKRKSLIFFDSFEKFFANNFKRRQLFIAFLKKVNESKNTTLILSSKIVDNNSAGDDVYSLINEKYVLRLNSENESTSILKTDQAYNLYGTGDGFIVKKGEDKVRMQICYVGVNEVRYITKVISFFYDEIAIKEDEKNK